MSGSNILLPKTEDRYCLITLKGSGKMLKKSLKRLTAMVVIVSMLLMTAAEAFAKETGADDTSGIYIATLPVPEEAISYAQTSVGGMIQDLYDMENVTVGQPFTVEGHFTDLYYFLIFSKEELVGYYRVCETDDGYTGIFSENSELINGFKNIEALTDSSSPASIIVGDYEDIYAVINGNVICILEDYAGNTTELANGEVAACSEGCDYQIVDAAEGIELAAAASAVSSNTYKYLNIEVKETQGSEPWCAAYVTAAICRYVTGKSSITASTIMKYFYPNLDSSELKEKSLSRSKVIAYGESLGLSPKLKDGRLTWSKVKSEINNDRPIYFAFENLSDSSSSHAMVCLGYHTNSGNHFYLVWNPWGTSFERVYTSTYIYTTSCGDQYKYYKTIYNWG